MIDLFKKYTSGKKVLILGFGREGRSTWKFIRSNFPELRYGIADKNPEITKDLPASFDAQNIFTGINYLEFIDHFDVIIKSPGIKISGEIVRKKNKTWLSQSGLFLEHFGSQVIGVTGTKGKSTTSSLIYHLLKQAGKKAVLVGNIGWPPLDLLDEIDDETHIVFELSANQLEFVKHAPHISVLLNLFPEHLDYFSTEATYFTAKLNIAHFQKPKDYFIFDDGNLNIRKWLRNLNILSQKIPLSDSARIIPDFYTNFSVEQLLGQSLLKGKHNQKNMAFAALATKLCDVSEKQIVLGIKTFQPLPHRLEFVGKFCGIEFYNDSISTVPESTIEALKTIPNVDMLVLGGFDRGIDYGELLGFLEKMPIKFIIFTGPAGRRMMKNFEYRMKAGQQLFFLENFSDLKMHLSKVGKGSACLLSPAAPSYDAFRDFEERGEVFKKMAENLTGSCP